MRDQRFRAEQSSPETSWKKSKLLAFAAFVWHLSGPFRNPGALDRTRCKGHGAFDAFIPVGIRIGLARGNGSRPTRGGFSVTPGPVTWHPYQYTSIWVSNAEIPFISQLAAILNNRCRSG
jgi:hypothetical protein